jgi:hypothetical protein
MTNIVEIYVELVDEGVEVWRPVAAIDEGDGVFRLRSDQPEGEVWAFPPGSRVRCEARELSGGGAMVAIALAD